MMASIFTRIIEGSIPCYKIAESADCFAFLDIAPVRLGHTLVIPKVEVDDLFELDDEMLAKMLPFAKEVARKIKAVIPCNRVGLSVVGLEVPHAHIHLLPINGLQDIDLGAPKLTLSPEEFSALAERIRNA